MNNKNLLTSYDFQILYVRFDFDYEKTAIADGLKIYTNLYKHLRNAHCVNAIFRTLWRMRLINKSDMIYF